MMAIIAILLALIEREKSARVSCLHFTSTLLLC
jgi:hypothetical protein